MNKTISITLNGAIFNIEEEGYEKLKKYLDSIRQYFSQTDGQEEIINDIESNITEKFSEKISAKKKVITNSDVAEIIDIMGSVEDFAQEANSSTLENETIEEEGEEKKIKRLYRDPDNAIIGGVCSGLGAYFNIDPVIFRVLFVAAFLFYGTGILLYILLWIAMPKAETSAQRLEMKGDSVTLKKIEESIKNKITDSRTTAKLKSAPRNILNAIFETLGNLIRKLGPLFLILLGIFIIAINIFMSAVATFVGAAFLFNLDSAYINSEIPIREILNNSQYYTGLISSYLIIIIPIIFFILIGLALAKRKKVFNTLGISIMIGIWMISILTFGLIALEAAPEIGDRIDQSIKESSVNKEEFDSFKEISISGSNNVNIRKGENYSIKLTGRESDLEEVVLQKIDNQLKISEETKNGLCLFCYDRVVNIDITMPELEYLKIAGNADASIKGFTNQSIKIDALDISDVEAYLDNPQQEINIKDSADFNLTGSSTQLTITLDDFAELEASSLQSQEIKIKLNDHSEADLDGKTKSLIADLERTADLFAFNLEAEQVKINMLGTGIAQVYASSTLESNIGEGEVYYRGNPELKIPREAPGELDNYKSPKKPIQY